MNRVEKVLRQLLWQPLYVLDTRDGCIAVNLTAVVLAVLVLLVVAKVIF